MPAQSAFATNIALQKTEAFLVWLRDCLSAKSAEAVVDLFHDDGWYRDILICDWDFNSIPKPQLAQFFEEKGLPQIEPSSLKLDPTKTPPIFAQEWISSFFVFETPIAIGQGVLRLKRNAVGTYKAFTLALVFSSFKVYPEHVGPRRPLGYEPDPFNRTWAQRRLDEIEFVHDDPTVLIVGAGQGGLMVAARLQRLGVSVLVIDKAERVGDTWRNRYRSLRLHDPFYVNGFPYLNYPDDWPLYISKDQMADWHEIYARALSLNVWNQTIVEPNSTSYDESSETWRITLVRGDGLRRTISCRHIVQATGLAGEPRIPKFDGVDQFLGTVVHSTAYRGPESWKGKTAIVVGTGNSGHDIAQELCEGGANVTMVQRSSALVFSRENGNPIFFSPAYWHNGPPAEESDLNNLSFPRRQILPFAAATFKRVNEADKGLLEGLTKAGFKLDPPGGPGPLFKQYERGGGFCVDVGSSALIIARRIKIQHGDIANFEKNGIRMRDGTFLPADLVVLATGFGTMRDTGRRIFGDKIIDRTGPVWGLDEQFEPRGVWRWSGHPGFWYMGSSVVHSRTFSKYLALQIKAIELGLSSKDRSSQDTYMRS